MKEETVELTVMPWVLERAKRGYEGDWVRVSIRPLMTMRLLRERCVAPAEGGLAKRSSFCVWKWLMKTEPQWPP